MSDRSPAARRGPRRVIVRPGDPATVAELLGGIAEDDALEEGRVFVAGTRVSAPGWRLSPGDVVEVHTPRETEGRIEVLARHAGFVFVEKPASLATEPDRQGYHSARSELALELGVDESTLHAVSRLDVGVSGVVTFAATPAAKRLAAARDEQLFDRRYVGITTGAPAEPRGEWASPVPDRRGKPPRPARTLYAVAGGVRGPRGVTAAVLALAPVTGRQHQLRRHCAGAGVPLLGDRRYGRHGRVTSSDGSVRALSRVALHAARVALSHAEIGAIVVRAPLPPELEELWVALGGDVADLQRAVDLELP